MKILLCLSVLVCAAVVRAEPPIVTTLVVKPAQVTNQLSEVEIVAVTNTVAIPNGQAARVASFNPWQSAASSQVYSEQVSLLRDGYAWTVYRGDVVQGPATFSVRCTTTTPTMLTLERWTVRKSK